MILIIIITNFLIGFVHVISCVPFLGICPGLQQLPPENPIGHRKGHLLEFQDLVFGEVELLSPVGKFSTAQSHVKVIGEKVIPFLWFYLIYIYIYVYRNISETTNQNISELVSIKPVESSCQTGSQAPGANFGEVRCGA